MKTIAQMIESIRKALADPKKPAMHLSVAPKLPVLRSLEEEITNLLPAFVPPGLEERIRKRDCLVNHMAWNFNGKIWFDGETFCEEVWVHRVPVKVAKADSLEILITSVNDEFGWD